MKEKRDFNVVLVEAGRPVADAWLTQGKAVSYDGREIKVKL